VKIKDIRLEKTFSILCESQCKRSYLQTGNGDGLRLVIRRKLNKATNPALGIMSPKNFVLLLGLDIPQ